MATGVAFVDSVASGAGTILNLNDQSTWWFDTIEAPAPQLRRQSDAAVLGDGDIPSPSSYSDREITIRGVLKGSSDATATAIQNLNRILDRETFILRWTPNGATAPVFALCKQSTANILREELTVQGIRQAEIRLTASPGLVGLPVDIASFVITNSPASGTNRMLVGPSVLGTIQGDLETPLILAQSTGPGVSLEPKTPTCYMQTYSLTDPDGTPPTHTLLARDLSELTSGVDVGAPVTGAGSNYIDGNYKSCSFAINPLNQRLIGSFSTALNPMPGQYRVLMRIVLPATAFVDSPFRSFDFVLRILVDGSSTYVSMPAIQNLILPVSTSVDLPYLIDFGVAQFPPRGPYGGIGLAPPAQTGRPPSFSIDVEELGGTDIPMRFDELFLLPVDTAFGVADNLILDVPPFGGSVPYNVLAYDGINNQLRALFDSGGGPFTGVPVPSSRVRADGGMPMVRPGANNYLTFIYNDLITTGTSTFVGRYYPRYLYARPAST